MKSLVYRFISWYLKMAGGAIHGENEYIVSVSDEDYHWLREFADPPSRVAEQYQALFQYYQQVEDIRRKRGFTVWRDGSYEQWGIVDAHYAKADKDYLTSIGVGEAFYDLPMIDFEEVL